MRCSLPFAFFILSSTCFAQDQYRQILLTDPSMSDGYFIVNETKRQQLGATSVHVDVIVNKHQSNGSFVPTTVQSLAITPPAFFAQADHSLIGTLAAGETVHYHLTATNANGQAVVDYENCEGCEQLCGSCPTRYENCRYTCNGPAYTWAMISYTNLMESNTVLSLESAGLNGSYLYFYVKDADWYWFTNHFQETAFGIPGYWSDYPWPPPYNLDHQEILHLDSIPSDAKDWQGISISQYYGGCWAVVKDLGPWRYMGSVSTNQLIGGGGEWCIDPDLNRAVYNEDENIEFQMSQSSTPQLTCAGLYYTGDGLNWWTNQAPTICTQISYSDGIIDPVGWTISTIECPGWALANAPVLSSVSSIIIDRVSYANGGTVLTIHVPDGNDPKLVPVEKTVLAAGLYEFTIVMDDGTMLRHFQTFPQAITASADFASFTQVNVYPVPVSGRSFSVDFDLVAPMDIDLTILNNSGTVYYSKSLSFGLAGRNKHVVEMANQWPSGIYHCIMQYTDGSSESLTITVQP